MRLIQDTKQAVYILYQKDRISLIMSNLSSTNARLRLKLPVITAVVAAIIFSAAL